MFFSPEVQNNNGVSNAIENGKLDETEPGVNKAVMHIDDGPHPGCSAINLACVVTSVGERWLSSSA